MTNAAALANLEDWADELEGVTVKFALMADTYTFDAAHDFYDDISAHVIANTTVTVSVTDNKATVTSGSPAGVVSWSPSAGTGYQGLWAWIDSGTPATSKLVSYHEDIAGGGTFAGTTSGAAIEIDFAAHFLII